MKRPELDIDYVVSVCPSWRISREGNTITGWCWTARPVDEIRDPPSFSSEQRDRGLTEMVSERRIGYLAGAIAEQHRLRREMHEAGETPARGETYVAAQERGARARADAHAAETELREIDAMLARVLAEQRDG